MLTRCPGCETHFRVTAEQLKARAGRVRCGECRHVFNALDSLVDESAAAMASPEEVAVPTMPPVDIVVPTAPPEELAVPVAPPEELAVPPALPEELAVPPAPSPGLPAETIEPDGETPEDISTLDAEVAEPILLVEAEPPDWSESFPEPPAPRRWPWVLASLTALAAIGLQAALAFRVELAVLAPEVRPALAALCDIAGCEVGLPAKVALVGIEVSDLHPDAEHPGLLALKATLKNRAPFAQAFPHLELTLTDTADKAIARKILAPADYLSPGLSSVNGMAPNADIVVAVGVDPGEMAASGYRLYLFYP